MIAPPQLEDVNVTIDIEISTPGQSQFSAGPWRQPSGRCSGFAAITLRTIIGLLNGRKAGFGDVYDLD
jgi:hypothetical protein